MGFLGRQLGLDRNAEEGLLLILAGALFAVSLFAGYRQEGLGRAVELPLFSMELHLLSTPIWLGAGVLCLLCLQQLYHSVWLQGVTALFSYVLTATGTLLFYVFYEDNYYWFLASLILILLAMALLYWLVLDIYSLRAQILDAAPEGEELSLGQWVFSLPLFLLLTMLSYYYYAKVFCGSADGYCADEGWFTFIEPRYGYLLSEVALFLVALYILWVPHTLMGPFIELVSAPVDAELLTTVPRPLRSCASCQGEVQTRAHRCPECTAVELASYCGRCEGYTLRCPDCGGGAMLGGECRKCGTATVDLQCRECDHRGPLRFWTAEDNS